jgi:transcriptional regulator with XRE-family HTH domain
MEGMEIVAEPSVTEVPPAALAAARERAGFTQEEVAELVRQPRPVISNWESGVRRPPGRALEQLAMIYRISLAELLGREDRPRADLERLLFRDAGDRLDAVGKFETKRFLAFLDAYGDFLEALGESPGLRHSPFTMREGFTSKEDVRRRAEDARSFLRVGPGPIGDLSGLMDLVGITVYRAPLGADLKQTISGAFVPHDRVGFSILLNAQTTPGRRRFTLAHELAHALFHGGRHSVEYYGRREAAERFADAFAAEFLVPTTTLRSAVEDSVGVSKVTDAEVVVHLQRLFNVSYAMMLVRLRSSGLVTEAEMDRLRHIRPVHVAQRLGYATAADEWEQDPESWGLARFPRRFLRLVRQALDSGRATASGVAAMTGLAVDDIEEFLADADAPAGADEEFEYLIAAS